MPTTRDDRLLAMLRTRGLRRRAARVISEASGAGRSASGRLEKRARAIIRDRRATA